MQIPTSSPPPVRDWSFIVLKVDGHGLAADIAQTIDGLDNAGTSPNAYITVRAEQQGKLNDYRLQDSTAPGHHLSPLPGGLREEPTSATPTLSQQAMTSFLLNAMQQAPAHHYYVIFEGHSRQLRQVVPEMHAALEVANKASGQKVDVLCFDACFMAQIEFGAQFKDVARTFVAAQSGMDKSRQVEMLAQELVGHPMTAPEMAAETVRLSQKQERTMSALDLSRMDPLENAMKAFGQSLQGIQDRHTLAEVRRAVHESQHFYTPGALHASAYHATVDIADAVSRIVQLPKAPPQLVQQGQQVLDLLKAGGSGPLLAEQHADKKTRDWTLDYSDDAHAHGLSIHFPTTPNNPWRSKYTWVKDSQFNRDTGWDDVVAHITSSHSPFYEVGSVAEDAGGLALWGLSLGLDAAHDHLPHHRPNA